MELASVTSSGHMYHNSKGKAYLHAFQQASDEALWWSSAITWPV